MSDILFLSHTYRGGTFRVGSHHLSREMAAMGHNVAHVSTPFSAVHAMVRGGQVERKAVAQAGVQMTEGVREYIPSPALPASAMWTQRQYLRVLDTIEMRHPDVVLVDQPLMSPKHVGNAALVFRPTDIFEPRGIRAAALKLARRADAIVATSPTVLAHVLDGRPHPHSCVIENGVEFNRFAQAADAVADKDYEFVYVGALDHRFDFAALVAAARRMPSRRFAVFGPLPATRIAVPANVDLAGPVRYEQVPEILARGRVGIMPFVESPLNAGRSPMKLYEYIAAGLPIVAPRTILARAAGLESVFPYDASTPEGFGQAAADSLMSRLEVSAEDRRIAAGNDWREIAARIIRFVE